MRLDELFGIGEIELLHPFENRYHFKFCVGEIDYQAAFQQDNDATLSIWSFAFWSESKTKGNRRPSKDMRINNLAGKKVFLVFTKIVSGIHKFIQQVNPDMIHFMADADHIFVYDRLGEYLRSDLEKIGYYLEKETYQSSGFYYIKPIQQRLDEKINLFRDIDLITDEYGDVHFEFKVNEFYFEGSFWNYNDDDRWEFEFSRKIKNKKSNIIGHSTIIDNSTRHSATLIFSYVLSALNRFIIDRKPRAVYFSADSAHQEMYDRLYEKLKADIPNSYKFTVKKMNKHKIYTLTKEGPLVLDKD